MRRSRRLTALLATVAVLATTIPAATTAADPPETRTYSPYTRGEYVQYFHKGGAITYEHVPLYTYFTTGREDLRGDTDPTAQELRSFFVFDVEPTDRTITKAVLRIVVPPHGYGSEDPSETFALVDVTSNMDALLVGGDEGTPGLKEIFDDLGGGHQYGSKDFTQADDGRTVDIPLDAAAKAMIKAGGRIAFGGHLTTGSSGVDRQEYLFQESGTANVRLQLTFAPPTPPVKVSKVDAWIRNGTTSVAGYGVVNTTGKDQQLTRSVKKGKSTTYRITITNFGSKKDAYKVKAAKGTSAYAIVYKQGSKVITSAVTSSGGYLTPKVKAGASLDLTMTVTVKSSAAAGSKISRPVTVTVNGTASVKDVVVAVVKRKS